MVIRDEENGEPLGNGFINFNKKSAAMEFLERNNGKQMPNSNQIYSLEIWEKLKDFEDFWFYFKIIYYAFY